MEFNADNAILAPWYIHPSHVVCGQYLHSMLPASHPYTDSLVHLRCDHPHSFFDGARVQSGIVKPKAIRVSNLRPFINPAYPGHQATFASDYEEYIDRYGSIGFNISCLPHARHGLIAQPNELHSQFPYFFSCLSTFQHQNSTATLETENVFKEMLRRQMPFLNCKKILYQKEHGGAACNVGTDAAKASDLRSSLEPDYLKHNDYHWQSGRTGSTEALSKCLQIPFKLYTKNSSMKSKVPETKKHKICVQKLKQKALNNYRKQFMAPFTGNVRKEVITKRRLESLKTIIVTASASEMKQRANNSEEVSSLGSSTSSSTSVESLNNAPKEKHEYDSVSLRGVNYQLPKDTAVASETQCQNDHDISKILTTAPYHSPQACVVDDKKTFKCPQCRYLTDRKNNLKRHVMTMHQDTSKSLECCGISFQNKAALRDHNSIFHRGGYRCQICSRNFCRKALLRRHLTVHSGQKDFFCDICGYATSHKSNLERHQKVHTKREPTIGGIRKGGSAKRALRLGAASLLSHALLNSRAQSSRYDESELTSALPKYETASKYVDDDRALTAKSPYSVFMQERPDNYMNKLQIVPSLKNALHNYTTLNLYQHDKYNCHNKNINMKREDRGSSSPHLQLSTY